MAMLTWIVFVFIAGSADRALVDFGVSYAKQSWV
jgi:hypothetical protein